MISDKAFNSVTFDPQTATYFGDCILVIKLRPQDRMMCINGSKSFYGDVFECLLSPGMSYHVMRSTQAIISKKTVTLYEVES